MKATSITAAGFCAQHFFNIRHLHAQPSKPNILFIMTDQQCADTMSCTGNPDLSTPAMDSIAANGTRFDSAYCSQPLCIPSRASMFTGKMPHETGLYINAYGNYVGGLPIMGTIFSNAGYDCGYVGKWHLPVTNTPGGEHGFAFVEHAKDNAIDPLVPQSCVNFINTQRTKPFLLVASFVNPHDICEWARGDALKNGAIPNPPAADQCPELPANFEIPPNEPEAIRQAQALAPQYYPTADWTTDKWRQYRWAFNRMTEKVDAQIGIILDALRTKGLENDTLIIFTTDHGDGNSAHHWNQKQILYEEAARIPFIVSYKGVTEANAVDKDHLTSNALDLIPTMCDYAGIQPPAGLTGQSVRDLAEGQSVTAWRDHLIGETEFCAWGDNSYGITGRMVRTSQYKYIVYSSGNLREQLFDMHKDPGEMDNLALNTDKAAVLNSHRDHLRAWCTQVKDNFDVPANTPVKLNRNSRHGWHDPQVELKRSYMKVRLSLPHREQVRVSLYGLPGHKVMERSFGPLNKGEHRLGFKVPEQKNRSVVWDIMVGTRRITGSSTVI